MNPRILAIAVILMLAAAARADDFEDIARDLASENPATVDRTLQRIRERLEGDPAANYPQIRQRWLKPLLDAGRNDDALDLLRRGIIAGARDVSSIEYLQRQRIDLLRKLHRDSEALSEAKALFNVCGMQSTEQSLLLLAECLNSVRGIHSDAVDQLITEQRAGKTSPTIQSIPLDASAYEPAIRTLIAPGGGLPPTVEELTALGNLLLLSDKPAEALKVFEQLQRTAGSDQRRLAYEGIARAYRAQDAAITRANAFADSVAAKK